MLKILICCGGGFSSSYITKKMNDEIIERKIENEVQIDFLPFSLSSEHFFEYDIVMCCPHLKIYINQLIKKQNPDIPLYILPPKMYGLMILDELIIDAQDVIKIYQQTKKNPVHFPGEENPLRIKRGVAYQNKNKV